MAINFKNNFVSLGNRAIVDPYLRIIVSMGRFYIEDEGWQVINIHHNPDLTSDVLSEIQEWYSVDHTQRFRIYPGHSENTRTLFNFTLTKTTEARNLVLTPQGPDDIFERVSFGPTPSGDAVGYVDPKGLLLYVLKNILQISELQDWGCGTHDKIQLRMSSGKFASLVNGLEERLLGDVLLDERDLRV